MHIAHTQLEVVIEVDVVSVIHIVWHHTTVVTVYRDWICLLWKYCRKGVVSNYRTIKSFIWNTCSSVTYFIYLLALK